MRAWRSRTGLERALLALGVALVVAGVAEPWAERRLDPELASRTTWQRRILTGQWRYEQGYEVTTDVEWPASPPGPLVGFGWWPTPRGPLNLAAITCSGSHIVEWWVRADKEVWSTCVVEPDPERAPFEWLWFHALIVAPLAGPALGVSLAWLAARRHRRRGSALREVLGLLGAAAPPAALLSGVAVVALRGLEVAHGTRLQAPDGALLGRDALVVSSIAFVVTLAAVGLRVAAVTPPAAGDPARP